MEGRSRRLFSAAATAAVIAFLAAPSAARQSEKSGSGVPDSVYHFERVDGLVLPAGGGGAGQAGRRELAVSLSTLGRDFDLELQPNDLFAPDAKNIWVDDAGAVEEAPEAIFYKGRVRGDDESWVRVALRDGTLDGVVHTAEETYFFEPAERFFAGSGAGEMIAYRLSDTELGWTDGGCATEDHEQLESPRRRVRHRNDGHSKGREAYKKWAASLGATGGGAAILKEIDLGLVSDWEYYNGVPAGSGHFGNSATFMQNIINQIDGVYEREIGVTLRIGTTLVHSSSSDPFSNTTSPGTLLSEIGTFRNNNDNVAGQPFFGADLVHLFTGRNLDGNVVGIAWVGQVCSTSNGAGLSQDYSATLNSLVSLTAHEMGHNMAANHDPGTAPCGSTFIMNPSVVTVPNLADLHFSSCSKTPIAGHVNSRSCVASVNGADPTATFTFTPTFTRTPTITRTPTRTPTPTATPTGPPLPVAQWGFDEGNGFTSGDSSGNSNGAVLENGASFASGISGTALSLDGSNDDARINDSPSLSIGGTALSLEAWVKPTVVNGYRIILHKENQYSLAIRDGKLAYADAATWSYATIGSFGVVPAGAWSHVAVTFDGSAIRFYVNGVLVGTKARAGSLVDNANPVFIGAYNGTSYRFAGLIDEVGVYNRVMDVATILSHFQEFPIPQDPLRALWQFEEGGGPTAGDATGNGNDASLSGAGWTSGVAAGGALSFDGVNDSAQSLDSASLSVAGTGLSIDAWVRPTVTNGYRILVHKENQFSLAIRDGALTYADSATWSYATIGSYGSVPANEWTHVAVTFDGSSIRFYVNGGLVGTKSRPASLTDNSSPVCLGAYGCSRYWFAGSLDEVAIHDYALSAGEVADRFNAGANTAMGASWLFDEGEGATAADATGNGNDGTLQNGAAWATGVNGDALTLDGDDDNVQVSDSPSLSLLGTSLTLEAWVNPDAVNGLHVVIHKEGQYSLVIRDGQLGYADSATWSYATIGYYGSVPAGTWSHVAVTFDGNQILFYVNGAEVGSKARPGSLTDNSNPVCIGSYDCSRYGFDGLLDDVQVHDVPLSAGELQAHAQG